MSTGRRIAKRSILGTRVAARRLDGLYYTGVICATKSGDMSGPRYSVRFDGSRYVAEFGPTEMVGPGFLAVADIDLLPGQSVHITHNGRDAQGIVRRCLPDLDQVWVEIAQGDVKAEVQRRVEEIRLWESRKSPRLVDSDTDFARLADVGVERKRSPGVDIPPANSSRKRRSSPSSTQLPGQGHMQGQGHSVGEMTECTAAMVLMSLSASPKSPKFSYDSGPGTSWSDQMSIGSSGSETSPPSASPPLSDAASAAAGSLDEGICMEDETMQPPQQGKQTVYKCTWPGCSTVTPTCCTIERHVRRTHLGPSEADSDLSDHEEEFYYTEVELPPPTSTPTPPAVVTCVARVDRSPPPPPTVVFATRGATSPSLESAVIDATGFSLSGGALLASSPPTLSHMDMARPPHEDPQYQRELARRGLTAVVGTGAAPIPIPQRHGWAHVWSSAVPGKYVRIGTKVITTSPKGSPLHRRIRGDVKKCRKVYGMEHREQWCTQCKWKKACTRFSGLMD